MVRPAPDRPGRCRKAGRRGPGRARRRRGSAAASVVQSCPGGPGGAPDNAGDVEACAAIALRSDTLQFLELCGPGWCFSPSDVPQYPKIAFRANFGPFSGKNRPSVPLCWTFSGPATCSTWGIRRSACRCARARSAAPARCCGFAAARYRRDPPRYRTDRPQHVGVVTGTKKRPALGLSALLKVIANRNTWKNQGKRRRRPRGRSQLLGLLAAPETQTW